MKKSLHKLCVASFLCALFSTFSTNSFSQAWAQRLSFGSATSGVERASGFALDAAGNLYVTGTFPGTLDFGNGVPSMTSTGNIDGYVAKFNAAGLCQWAIKFNGPGTAQDQGLGIATNGTAVYVGGVYTTSLSINGATAIIGYGGIDCFGMKLDAATGATQWATVFGGGSTDGTQAMCIDTSGNMYCTGYFSTNTTYPTATFGSFTKSTNGVAGTDSYVTKLDKNTGSVVWVSTGGMATYNDNVSNSGIAYSPALNAIVMVGSAQAPAVNTGPYYATYFNSSPAANIVLTSQGGLDVIVAKLDAATGTYQNVQIVGGAANSNEEALAATYEPISGCVILTGYFNTSALTFGTTPTIATYGSDDFFYTAYNPVTNTFSWAKSAGSTIQDRGQSIATNGLGKVIITGRYRNTLVAPSLTGSISVTSSRTASADEIFMLQLNAFTGNAELLLSPQGDATTNIGDIGTASAAGNGNIWIGGQYGGSVSFSPLSSVTASGATQDILMARYGDPALLPLNLLSFAGQKEGSNIRLAWKVSGTADNSYFELERSPDGRSFSTISRQQAKGQNTGTVAYQWVDPNAVNSSAVQLYYLLKMVSNDGTISYSSIIKIPLGGNDNKATITFANPVQGALTLYLNLPVEQIETISLMDVNGRKIASRQVQLSSGYSSYLLTETATLVKGVYLLDIQTGSKHIVERLVKE